MSWTPGTGSSSSKALAEREGCSVPSERIAELVLGPASQGGGRACSSSVPVPQGTRGRRTRRSGRCGGAAQDAPSGLWLTRTPYGVRELAQRAGVALGSLSRVLDLLAREGLVTREPSGTVSQSTRREPSAGGRRTTTSPARTRPPRSLSRAGLTPLRQSSLIPGGPTPPPARSAPNGSHRSLLLAKRRSTPTTSPE